MNDPRSKAGFTLMEVLVVMSIMVMLGSMALILSMDAYRGFAFRSERDTLISALHKARSQSVNNVCLGSGCTDGKAHGVHVATGEYTIFQGKDYVTRDANVDEVIPSAYQAVSVAPTSLTEVVFAQLSGSVALTGTIGLIDSAGHISTTTVNSEGQITWDH